ncbi:hypothetical protein L6164_011321 [Bauhinia variegata]|uniref:Uncharacterized protein n=1 Tax=Bauhinia variegata TaxID=167791 RepID=A0ACB9P6Q8_BAUVA|nr:hypothetical protein L6164_011321 [Bauhinia variegata]
MIIKTQHVIGLILCLSLFLILFHDRGWFNFDSSNNGNNRFSVSRNRRMLASNFDFTPFLHRHRHHRHHHHRSHRPVHPEPAKSDIDPRYGAQKRLVPTGPNPLHH